MEEEKNIQEKIPQSQTESTGEEKESSDISEEKGKKEEAEKVEKKEKGEAEPIDFSALLPDTIDEILTFSFFNLVEWARIYLGFLMHPKQKKILKDIRQAKIAIDAATALAEVLIPLVREEQQREFKILISDLKMNFVAKSAEG